MHKNGDGQLHMLLLYLYLAAPSVSIGVTESSEKNLDSNLTSLRWSHLNVLDDQWFVGFPGHRSYTNIYMIICI